MNEPVLDGKVRAILLALIARDGVVTKDVQGSPQKGQGLPARSSSRMGIPKNQRSSNLNWPGAGVAQGWGWWHCEPAGGAWYFLEGEADGVPAGCCVHECSSAQGVQPVGLVFLETQGRGHSFRGLRGHPRG
jgi:hypothetical protein